MKIQILPNFLIASAFLPLAAQANQCATNLSAGNTSLSQLCNYSIEKSACNGDGNFQKLEKYIREALVVGITGFHNERNGSDYMGALGEVVADLNGTFVRIDTDSNRTIEEDAPAVCRSLSHAINATRKRHVIVIGHSKGGATALYLYHKCAGVMQGVEGVALVNAVVRGSFYADASVNRNGATREAARALQAIGRFAPPGFFGDTPAGISMTTALSTKRLAEIGSSAQPNKTFCVVSSSQTEPVGELNDKLVTLAEQSHPAACRTLINVSGAHHKALMERDSEEGSAPMACKKAFAGHVLNSIRKSLGR